MEIIILAVLIILCVGLYYSFNVIKKILNTHTMLTCKLAGLKVYDQWLENFKYNPKGGVEHYEPRIRYDFESNECLLAVGYKARIEDEKGYEYQIVWEVFNIINGYSYTVDQCFYGTALPHSTAGDGDRKKTKEEIEHDENERKRMEKMLKPFYQVDN